MSKASSDRATPISATEAKTLFADWRHHHVLVLAVSGGPDSMALLQLAARWRDRLKRPPQLVAVTVDHGLRRAAAGEAQMVAQRARSLKVDHAVLRWRGKKPQTGLPAAAREARYRLLMQHAQRLGANAILTAHTRDDQAETVLMRMARGSGITGLAGMRRHARPGAIAIGRPFLDIPKARLIATCAKLKIAYADDPTNRDPRFTRPRWRALLPQLSAEGIDTRTLARLAARMARADEALDGLASAVEDQFVKIAPARASVIHRLDFISLPDEIRLRLLMRCLDAVASEGRPELGKAESLLEALAAALAASARSWRRTLAGAMVTLDEVNVTIEPAPARRARPGKPAKRRFSALTKRESVTSGKARNR